MCPLANGDVYCILLLLGCQSNDISPCKKHLSISWCNIQAQKKAMELNESSNLFRCGNWGMAHRIHTYQAISQQCWICHCNISIHLDNEKMRNNPCSGRCHFTSEASLMPWRHNPLRQLNRQVIFAPQSAAGRKVASSSSPLDPYSPVFVSPPDSVSNVFHSCGLPYQTNT